MDLVEATHLFASDGARHPWETARLDVVRKLIARHVELSPGSVVIDIGCGDAFVVASLAAEFPDVTFHGIDSGFSEQMIAQSAQRLKRPNLRLVRRLEEITPRPARAASLVLLMDVIEHIEDDGGFLDDLAARDFVDRGTCVLVTVPAYQWLFSAHDVFLHHYRRYSNRTLRSRLEGAGFQVQEIGYFFLSLLAVRLLQLAKEKVVGRRPGGATGLTDQAPGAAIVQRALMADSSLAFALRRLGINLPGLSNFAVCRRSV
jgi:SAM-dependent methyltransferase